MKPSSRSLSLYLFSKNFLNFFLESFLFLGKEEEI